MENSICFFFHSWKIPNAPSAYAYIANMNVKLVQLARPFASTLFPIWNNDYRSCFLFFFIFIQLSNQFHWMHLKEAAWAAGPQKLKKKNHAKMQNGNMFWQWGCSLINHNYVLSLSVRAHWARLSRLPTIKC